ncbi:ECF transporter S component [Butyrivibrio sp. YAB3001]|uniref:ECF transporter S component n=1 Tax=Butyrivibrio sp. YAB3001 TaxID=1520812 RepID=UPI0008F667B2|nr:ECF transporter S component [Butyrivibrio sp. YAB3001]SFC93154.1 hypothetical protein SAMN02910398_03563 [Butyrivibrio sp. YAB3001]
MKKYFGTREITITAALLAICIVSQFFKNLSIFITGPIINACLIVAVLAVNLVSAIILSVITPVTAYLIAASPVMMAVPGIIPLIMAGNIVLVVTTHFLLKKSITKDSTVKGYVMNYFKAFICALAKGLFMGVTISLWLLPTFIPAESLLRNKMGTFQITFSVFQFITAVIGFVYALIIWMTIGKFLKNNKLISA